MKKETNNTEMDSKVENNRNKPGKPKGLPRSGGRQAGTLNKKSIWLREELESAGLDWGIEFKKAVDTGDFKKAEILCALLPYLNPKIKEKDLEVEETPVPSNSTTTPITQSLLNIIK